jgi:hypothetical protein
MPSKFMEYFNQPPRAGILCTADKGGIVDAAVFSSPIMTDERTVVMGLGMHHPLANLQENPHAVFLIVDPADTLSDWKGARVYLKVKELAMSGPLLDDLKKQITRMNGEAAANIIEAAGRFEIVEARPIIDMGRTLEQSL